MSSLSNSLSIILLKSGLNGPPWGSAFLTCIEHTFVHHTTAEIFVDKAYHPAILYRAAEDFYEFAMAHGVEETLQVEVDHIDVAIINYFLRNSQGIMATSSRAEAVASWRELALIDGGLGSG